nr:MAG TPA: Large Terminase [Caudoviricetes sp.]
MKPKSKLSADEIATLRCDLLEFSKYMFKARKGFDFVENWHHAKICEALERCFIGQYKRLIINIPPRYSKTELAVVNFMAWAIGNYPDCEFIHASYSKRLAANNTYQARAIAMSEEYHAVFGDIGMMADAKAKDEWRTKTGGCVYATGSEGTITGYGAGRLREGFGGAIIIDDPHKASEANSDTMRQNVIDWFQTTMESRLNSPDTPIIVIMQRLHEEDLAGWLQAGGNGEEWHVLSIPAINPDDTALWPFKHSREKLAEMEASNPYVFAGQYMQRPAPKGGGLFKDSWWQWYDNSFVHPEWDYRVIYADTALKTKEHNDWSVFQCWGFKNGHAYLLDQIRGKWEAPELIKQARAFWDLHKSPINRGVVRGMKIEDKASGTGLIQTLKMEGVPVIPIQRSVDKFTRALDVLPQIEAGLVHLPKDAPWMPAYIGEFSVFPNGKHDDQVDPTLDAISDNLVTGYNLSAW